MKVKVVMTISSSHPRCKEDMCELIDKIRSGSFQRNMEHEYLTSKEAHCKVTATIEVLQD